MITTRAPDGANKQKAPGRNLVVKSRVVIALHSEQLNKPLVEHLLPFCHHVSLEVAEGLLAGEGDLEELWELGGEGLVEEKEVTVSAENFPP